jgi:5-methylcytosine-specific restriction endonuclease McrA
MDPLNQDVLVLNSDYEPINICNIRRAIGLICLGKVDVLHTDSVTLHTTREAIVSPSVVRLKYHVKRPMPRLRLSRRSIFARDNYTCQYCGQTAGDLTVDHVVPRRLGGRTEWENLVCCCKRCNGKKGDKTLAEVGFHLARPPRRPRWVPFVSLTKYMDGKRNQAWRDYLPHTHGWGGRDAG